MWDQEDQNRAGRAFVASWRRSHGEAAEVIARRLKATVERLSPLGILAEELRPWTESRALRASDPTIVELAASDLGRLIDRRARFDPPQLPAPVSSTGYAIFCASRRAPDDIDWVHLDVRAAAFDPRSRNNFVLKLHGRNPVWGDEARAQMILAAVIELWEPDRAAVRTAAVLDQENPRPWWSRYWMYWTKDGSGDDFHVDCRPPTRPAELSKSWLGGRLDLWPSEGGMGAPGVWPAPDSGAA